jgi:hypothetical protein
MVARDRVPQVSPQVHVRYPEPASLHLQTQLFGFG